MAARFCYPVSAWLSGLSLGGGAGDGWFGLRENARSREQAQKKYVSHPATKGENACVVQRPVAELRHPVRQRTDSPWRA